MGGYIQTTDSTVQCDEPGKAWMEAAPLEGQFYRGFIEGRRASEALRQQLGCSASGPILGPETSWHSYMDHVLTSSLTRLIQFTSMGDEMT